MTYELARALKDAGFPFRVPSLGDGINQRGEVVTSDQQRIIPTLEELIEACGESFKELNKGYIDSNDERKVNTFIENGWQAVAVLNEKLIFSRGSTPTEAVARLWLALNKHD